MYRNGERGSGMKYIEIYKCRERQWQGKTIQILEYQTDMRTCRFDKPSSLLRSYIADTSALPMLELGSMPVVTTLTLAALHFPPLLNLAPKSCSQKLTRDGAIKNSYI